MFFLGEEGASIYLNGLHNCLTRYEEFSGNITDPDNYCPVIYDSWNCWEASDPGTIQEQPCPNFPHLGFSPSSKYSLLQKIQMIEPNI